MSVNKVILVGRLGKTPEVRLTSSGKAVASFSLATQETWKENGKKCERTEWHNIAAFGNLAETCCEYLSKGSQVYVEGKIKTEEWTDKDGFKRRTTKIHAAEVRFLDGKKTEPRKAEGREPGCDDDMNF